MQRPLGKRFFWAPCAVVLFALSGDLREAQAYETFLEVSRSDAGFTVEAEEASLLQILQALGREAGFTIRDSGAPHPPIPLFEAKDATLDATLRRLLGNANHLILYRGDPGKKVVGKVILLSPGGKRDKTRPTVSSLAGPGGLPAPRRGNEIAPRAQDDSELEGADVDEELLDEELLDDREESKAAYSEDDGATEEETALQIEASAAGIDDTRAQLPPALLETLKQARTADEMDRMLTPDQLEQLRAAGLEDLD